MKNIPILHKNKGFTFTEVMIAVFVLLVALVSLLGAMYHFYLLSETLKERSIAIGDARKVLENIREASYSSLPSVTGADWAGWALNNGCDQLNAEEVSVVFADTSSDPLEVTVSVEWIQRSRPRSIEITTLVTER
ncbi:MAG: hypothetical protein AUJ75_02095 [Candidatus Omnitrophica bacterium CG1_02_49_10]|nr:MAG: hypothetical protein AUJ75_02095 [Candidatus Omnitrophica bacterium CG1_02_49_10]